MRSQGIMVHPKPHSKLRDLLVAPKDPVDNLDKTGVVYHIPCGDYDSGCVRGNFQSFENQIERTYPDLLAN